MNEPLLIEAEDLSKSYGKIPALQKVGLALPAGGIGLVGPNGAGKTTFLKILLGLLRPDRGRIRVLGMDPSREGLQVRARVGFVPEDDCYWEGLSAVGSVQYAGRLSGLSPREALKRAHEALDHVGLDQDRYRQVETFSMGMRQKVRMAQAVVHQPDLLILDEPTRSLDPAARSSLVEWILELRKTGVSVLVSSHELPEIERICDQVVLLIEGKIVAHKAIKELLSEGHQWEIQSISPPEEISVFLLSEFNLESKISGDRIRFTADQLNPAKLIFGISRKRIQIRALNKIGQTLDSMLPDLIANRRAP